MMRIKSFNETLPNSIINHIFFISIANDTILFILLKEVPSLYYKEEIFTVRALFLIVWIP